MRATEYRILEVLVREDDGRTYAEARLFNDIGNDIANDLVGKGRATLNPADPDIPQIGDELAVARALTDLGHRLLVTAARDIRSVTHEPVRLSH
jgi:hypothetical protein